jgi:hypothetical protein
VWQDGTVVRFQVGQGGGQSIQLVEPVFVSCQAVHDVSAGYVRRGLRDEVILRGVQVCNAHAVVMRTP